MMLVTKNHEEKKSNCLVKIKCCSNQDAAKSMMKQQAPLRKELAAAKNILKNCGNKAGTSKQLLATRRSAADLSKSDDKMILERRAP
jgi:hypothetical protein